MRALRDSSSLLSTNPPFLRYIASGRLRIWVSELNIYESHRETYQPNKHIERIKSQFPEVNIQLTEFENMSFKEQLEPVHNTDILVGVHGAGLIHGIFLRPNSALVEIMPPGLDHKGFRNLAKQMGHLYFRAHGSEQPDR